MTHQARFRPSDHQMPLPSRLILKDYQVEGESLPLDVVFVGAGPAGLCGAIELARLVKADQENEGGLGPIEIGVLEKAAHLGGHSLSGAVINPKSLQELFPGMSIKDFPFRGAVKGDAVYWLTPQGRLRIPAPPTMNNHGNHVASLCEVVRWLGERAEEMGVNILTSQPAESLLTHGECVTGVRIAPTGLDRTGQPGAGYMPGTDVEAKITVLTEGTRGPLGQAYMEWQKIQPTSPQIFALGVKELWRTKQVPENVIHTLGWPLPNAAFGGSFLYPMGEDTVALGLVVGLDYPDPHLDVHELLQKLKKHPLISPYLAGGECLEWGAKTIPEGGYHSLPKRFHGDGLLMAGDTVGFVNVPALKGIHYAMYSGILAARSAFQALKANDVSARSLAHYDEALRKSFIVSDLYKVRNMRQAFKSGLIWGGIKAGLITATGGALPGDHEHRLSDADEWKESARTTEPKPSGGLSKVDAVYLSGNKTRDDIPQHLIVGKDISPEVAEFYTHLCPAGVYERLGDQLVVNSPNCVDCKATDVLGPRWTVREGGSGPNYRSM